MTLGAESSSAQRLNAVTAAAGAEIETTDCKNKKKAIEGRPEDGVTLF